MKVKAAGVLLGVGLTVLVAGSTVRGTGPLISAFGPQSAGPDKARPTTDSQRALVDKYCVTCHNERIKTAGLMLDKMDLAHVPEGAPVWEKPCENFAVA